MARKKEKQTHKTNAVRLVEAEKVSYRLYSYDAPGGFLDGASVAEALGQDPRQVFKTLLTVGSSRQHYVCVVLVGAELDLKKAARCFGEKKLEMELARRLTAVTGYVKGGCSPIGMKKPLPTAVDVSAEALETVIVSGGKVGLQIELPLAALLQLTEGKLADLTAQ